MAAYVRNVSLTSLVYKIQSRHMGRPMILQEIQHRNASTSGDELNVRYLEREHEGVVVFGINRPAANNSINKNLLYLATEAVRYDKNVRSVIFKSDVPGIFCAGADLEERATLSPNELAAFVERLRKFTTDMSNLPMPVIAALDGTAIGWSLGFALACDMRTTTSTTQLGLVETRQAIIPGDGGTQRLTRLVGSAVANELIFTARAISGAEAAKLGIVNYAVEQDESNEAAYKKALDIAKEIIPQRIIIAKDLCGYYTLVIGTIESLGGAIASTVGLPPGSATASKTLMGLVETRMAIFPSGGGTQRLPRLVGSAVAKELIFTARVISGAEAAKMGIVNHSVEQDESNEAAYKKALDIAKEIVSQGPIGVQMVKLAINQGVEIQQQVKKVDIKNIKRGFDILKAIPAEYRTDALMAFREKRKPQFNGE